MSRKRVATRTAAPAVELVMAHCSLCHERARCANVTGKDAPVCAPCAISMAQLIAASKRSAARPHAAPCACAECWAFDGGQLGEVDNHLLLDDEGRIVSSWNLEERARVEDSVARFRQLEVDD